MATKATAALPSGIIAVHVANSTTGDYHRFEPGFTSNVNIQKPGNDDAEFNTTTITFSVSGNNVTATLPSGSRSAHVLLNNEHYYRFESSGATITVALGDASLFTTVSFTAS